MEGASAAVHVQLARSSASSAAQSEDLEDYSGWAAEAQGPVGGMSGTLWGSSSSASAASPAARGGDHEDYSGWAAEAQGPVGRMSGTLWGGPSSSRVPSSTRGPSPTGAHGSGHAGGTVPPDALRAALTKVDVNKLPRKAVWRTTREPLYRNDSRPWYIVFKQGFAPKNPANTNLRDFLHSSAPSAYVATTTKPDLNWPFDNGDAYTYQIDAPGGIDANKTYPQTAHPAKYDEAEIDFPGGISPKYIKGCYVLQEDGSRTWMANDGYSG
jgi:scabin-like protein